MDGRRILRSLARIVPASAAMAVIGWWIARDPMWDSPGNILLKVQWLAGGMAASMLFYIAALWALGSEELRFLWGAFRRQRRAREEGAA